MPVLSGRRGCPHSSRPWRWCRPRSYPVRVALSERHLAKAVTFDCTDARPAARSAVEAFGARAAPHFLLAYCDLSEGRSAAAVIHLERAVERDPRDWRLWYLLARARSGAGREARPAARRAAALNPKEPLAAEAVHAVVEAEDVDELPLIRPRVGDP